MTNRVAIVRASIWRTLQQRGIIQADARRTHQHVRDTAVPDAFTFRGIDLTWPFGREHDQLTGVRLERLNAALVANQNRPIPPHLADMRTSRLAYTALWHRTQQADYDPTAASKPTVEHVIPKRKRVSRKAITALEAALRELENR